MALNKMDWQKNLLIAAMIAVLFMLVIRWNDFQENLPTAQSPVAEATRAIDIGESSDVASDIPSLPNADGAVADNTANPQVSQGRIKVFTDSLALEIDPQGGDIVKVALPLYYAELETPDVPFVLLDSSSHTYIAQSGLIGANGTDSAQGRPLFNAEKNEYRLADDSDKLVVDLQLQQGEVSITKRFIFTRGEYVVELEYLINNQGSENWSGALYGQIKRDGQNFHKVSALQMNPFLGAAITTPDENYKKLSFDDLIEKDFKTSREGGWVAMVQHYFISAWIPDAESQNHYHLRRSGNQDLYLLGFTSQRLDVAPGNQGSVKAQFYAGPKDTERLEEISPYLDLTVDYGWLWWIAKPLFWLLKVIHELLGNWGLAIIGLTVVVKAAFFQLSAASYRSMAKMRKLAPKLQDLKDRCGGDRQKMSQEMMKLYKDEKVNPLGGCLPILVQMPVFLALYWVLMESVELRHSPFFFWIQDLSVKDPYFVLPLIMGLTMFIQMKLNPTPPDPMQARVMQLMPIVFTFMFLWFPAGLVLYWVTNNTLGILQQWYITRQIDNADKKA
jgi:YidC/Oxa1 family membrane protein insertase